jgi:arabinose-5-phosphate isomerase
MTEKRLGMVGVTDEDGRLVGVITDGDLRRNIERGLDHTAADFMTANPKTVAADTLVGDATMLFEEYKITSLFVVEENGGKKPVGVLHIHDCPSTR